LHLRNHDRPLDDATLVAPADVDARGATDFGRTRRRRTSRPAAMMMKDSGLGRAGRSREGSGQENCTQHLMFHKLLLPPNATNQNRADRPQTGTLASRSTGRLRWNITIRAEIEMGWIEKIRN
jgi:hypothetical protein